MLGRKKLKIGTKLNLLMIGVVVFLSIIIAFVTKYQIEKVMAEVFTARVNVVSQLGYNWLDETYPGEWSIRNNELYKGEVKINENNDLLDKIGDITDGAATIFQGDTRVATNVIENGQRKNGTKADPKVASIVLETGQPYLGEADIVGKKHLTKYEPIQDQSGETIGMWLVGPPIDVIQKSTSSLLFILIIVLVITGTVAVIISVFLTRSIVRPLLTIKTQLRDIAEGEGDLTKELSVKSQDEIGDLASSFNLMLKSLRTMIRQVGSTSEQVAASSEELTASAEQTTQATEQISVSIQEIAVGAEKQGHGVTESSRAMQDITVHINQVAETAASVSETSLEANKEANLGNDSLKQVIEQMDSITVSVDDSATVIRQLGDHSKEIGKIIEVITGISEQTNLLALNAAIEAARAGEHGKGFAVVADEVRKLAEQSKESADQIANLITKIQNDTEHAVEVMNKGTQEVAIGVEIVHSTEKRFEKILQSVEQVASQIQEVLAVSGKIAAGAEQVNASFEEITKIAQASASNTHNVASASEEQLASMEEMTASSENLSKLAEDLQVLVAKFKV